MRIWLSSCAIESIVEGDAGAGAGADVAFPAPNGRDRAFGSTDALLVRGLGVGIAL